MTEKETLQERDFCCEYHHEHPMLIEDVHQALPAEEEMLRAGELFKVLGDGTRIRILFVLLASEMCVCDLSETLNMTVSAVSHQLKALRLTNLVKSRRDGQVVYYSLADDHVKYILDIGFDHIRHE